MLCWLFTFGSDANSSRLKRMVEIIVHKLIVGFKNRG
jgi:hypothetical protein